MNTDLSKTEMMKRIKGEYDRLIYNAEHATTKTEKQIYKDRAACIADLMNLLEMKED